MSVNAGVAMIMINSFRNIIINSFRNIIINSFRYILSLSSRARARSLTRTCPKP